MNLTERQQRVLRVLAPLAEPIPTLEVSHRYELLQQGVDLPPDCGHEQGTGWRLYTTVYPVLRQLKAKGLVTCSNLNVHGYWTLAVYWALAEGAEAVIHLQHFLDGYPLCWPQSACHREFEGSYDHAAVTCPDCLGYLVEQAP